MSQENLETVRRMIRAFNDGDYEESLAAFHPEVEFDVSIRPEGRIYRGHAGVIEAIRTWNGTWEDFRAEIEKIMGNGEHVVLIDRQTGRGKGSGSRSTNARPGAPQQDWLIGHATSLSGKPQSSVSAQEDRMARWAD